MHPLHGRCPAAHPPAVCIRQPFKPHFRRPVSTAAITAFAWLLALHRRCSIVWHVQNVLFQEEALVISQVVRLFGLVLLKCHARVMCSQCLHLLLW